MDIQRLRKYCLDNIYLFLFLILFLPTDTQARSIDAHAIEIDNQLLVKDVSYDYQLISDRESGLDCIGSLSFSMSLPKDISTLIFERTNRQNIVNSYDDLHFTIKSEYPVTTEDLTIPDIYWNTHFRICAVLKNNERLYSSTYSVNEYIDSSDFELLSHQDSSSIENIDTDSRNVCIYIKNKKLEIITQEPIYMTIFDLCGVCIFNRDISIMETISLNDVISPFLIIRYKTSKNSFTKKIIL